MIARDQALTSLYAARDALGELIVRWTPRPDAGAGGSARPAQAESLQQLLLARDRVSAAINTVIGGAFRDVHAPELLAAARELSGAASRLEASARSIAQVDEVLKHVDEAVRLAGKMVALI